MHQILTRWSIVLLIAAALGCQQSAPPPPKREINLIGELATRPDGAQRAPAKASFDEAFVNTLGMRMVPVQPATFTMGSPVSEQGRQDDEHAHEVQLTRPYYIAATEVTQRQWQTVMGTAPWHNQRGAAVGKDQPATHMTYDQARQFCLLLSRQENAQYRLPTEAEWERACRASGTGMYGFDGAIGDHGWIDANTPHDHAAPVGRKKPNAWGLYDMHGNVAEWCSDWYGPYPRGSASGPTSDPRGAAMGDYRVVRGGAWDAAPRFCRCAYRSGMDPQTRSGSVGLRVVLTR